MELPKQLKLSVIINVITVIILISTIGGWIYFAGKKSSETERQIQRIEFLESEVKILKNDYNEQTNVTTAVNAKLDLLLDHFNIASSDDNSE